MPSFTQSVIRPPLKLYPAMPPVSICICRRFSVLLKDREIRIFSRTFLISSGETVSSSSTVLTFARFTEAEMVPRFSPAIPPVELSPDTVPETSQEEIRPPASLTAARIPVVALPLTVPSARIFSRMPLFCETKAAVFSPVDEMVE